MALLDRRTISILLTILLFAAAGAFIYRAGHTLVLFLFAIFFAYLLDPAVSRLQHWSPLSKGSRGRAILQAYVVLALVLAVLLIVVGPRLVSEGGRLGAALPDLLTRVTSGQILSQIGSKRGWSHESQLRLQQFLAGHRGQILAWAQAFGVRAAQFVSRAFWLVLIPILAVFFLKDGPDFAAAVVDTLERRNQRQLLRGVLDDVNVVVARYIRAQLVLAALSLIVYTIVLSLLRVPYSVVLGSLAGMMEFIPLVGPLVAAGTILAVSFLANYQHLLILAIFLGVWRLVQDYVNAPRIMGSTLELNPLATIFAVLAGAEVAGVLGVYLSIPIMATLRIVWRRWRTYSDVERGRTCGVRLPAKDRGVA